MTEDGADFSVHAAPTVRSLTAELSGLEHPPQEHNQLQPDAKAKAKAKPRAKPKAGKGKGWKGKAAGAEGEDGPAPDKVPTALEKATALKSKVFLVWSYISFQPQNKTNKHMFFNHSIIYTGVAFYGVSSFATELPHQ